MDLRGLTYGALLCSTTLGIPDTGHLGDRLTVITLLFIGVVVIAVGLTEDL